MLGTFQKSNLRIEIDASANTIADSLKNTNSLGKWLWPQRFSSGLPEQLHSGLIFTSWMGPIAIQHEVNFMDENSLRLLLSQGIDGYHEWCWSDGWVQSKIEGISLLPLNLGQTLSLLRLKQFVMN